MAVDMSLHLGNLIPLALAIIGFIWKLSRMDSAYESLREKVADLMGHRDKHDHRIRGVEQAQVAVVTELRGINEGFKAVRDDVREIRDEVRQALRERSA